MMAGWEVYERFFVLCFMFYVFFRFFGSVRLNECLTFFRKLQFIILVRSIFVDNQQEMKGFNDNLVFLEIFRSFLRGKNKQVLLKIFKLRDIVFFCGKLLFRNVL